MIGLIQRVKSAYVEIDGQETASIERGMLVLAAVQRGDGVPEAERLAERLLGFRVFADAAGRMNLPLDAVGGALLLVPQFTLAADTRKGNRPGFSRAADPADGQRLFDALLAACRARCDRVAAGRFGADMQVGLINDGPVTFWVEVPPASAIGTD